MHVFPGTEYVGLPNGHCAGRKIVMFEVAIRHELILVLAQCLSSLMQATSIA